MKNLKVFFTLIIFVTILGCLDNVMVNDSIPGTIVGVLIDNGKNWTVAPGVSNIENYESMIDNTILESGEPQNICWNNGINCSCMNINPQKCVM